MGEQVPLPPAERERYESLDDRRVRQLLDRYVSLSGAPLVTLAPDLQQLSVPAADRAAFGRRSAIRLAFSAEALSEDENAELAIIGSAFVNQLIAAIRRRGARIMVGRVGSPTDRMAAILSLPAPVTNGRARDPVTRTLRHRIGRLTARVVVRAGADVREHLAESDLIDLSTGTALGLDIIAACEAAARQGGPSDSPEWAGIPAADTRPMGEVVERMLGSLEQRLRPEIESLSATSERALRQELARIERYYSGLLDDVGGRGTQIADAETRAAYRAEHKHRAREEAERHQVRATVHPVQLAEWEVAVQRCDWFIESDTGHRGRFTAQRVLAGDRAWMAVCPTCGIVPSALTVCVGDHVGCAACTQRCSVCDDALCRQHGIHGCHVDGAPACARHARNCASCHRSHCSAHEGVCDESGHAACSACLTPCAHCGRVVCDHHAVMSHRDAPRGSRRLCSNCVRACEGGTGEIVGPDEATGCASCRRVVCERHQARCAVDGLVHCSSHLRRADRSRRLVCEKHRAVCRSEPNAVLATDEVATCATCGATSCSVHSGVCVADRAIHCVSHLVAVRDMLGALACEAHRTVCHVDGGVFSTSGTAACPACGRSHCKDHRRTCRNCGRSVCTSDFRPSDATMCATCTRLADAADLPDEVLAAVADARGSDDSKVKQWRSARDARHVVIELDLGWTRRLVIAVPHGGGRAESMVSHSLFGSRTRRA